MYKAQIILTIILIGAIIAGITAFTIHRENLKLYFLTTLGDLIICVQVRSLTTTNLANANSFPPAGATGWYTTTSCEGEIFYARTTND